MRETALSFGLRFPGRKTTPSGDVHGKFAGEVLSELRRRPEGVRIKHRLNFNSIKMRPLEAKDRALLETVMRGEFAINGFRNGELRAALFGTASDENQRRRQSANVTRRLRLLRAHRWIKKVATTHRYVLTPSGRTAITAFLAALNCDTQQLNQLAA